MKERYFKTPGHFANHIRKVMRECIGKIDSASVLPLETYVDLVYNGGVADVFGLQVKKNPRILEEDILLEWLRTAKNGGFSFPTNIELITTQEFQDCIKSLRKRPGCYSFWSRNNIPLYIGTSVDLSSRIVSSFHERFRHFPKLVYLRYVVTKTASDAALCEVVYIARHKPSLNGVNKFNDSLTIDVNVPALSERIQCNIPGEKKEVRNPGREPIMVLEEQSAEDNDFDIEACDEVIAEINSRWTEEHQMYYEEFERQAAERQAMLARTK